MYADVQADLIRSDIEAYLRQHQEKELLRFVAIGSVDDGKSTLIGRLLHDCHGIYEDQLAAVKRASSQGNMEVDLSLFTDGLVAEREQGITIDVAYRYFSTVKRKFIIADTPGHLQYTRNMATGASTANVAVILIDARLGVLQQSRRHAYIAHLLGIEHLAVAVNKMDLRDYSEVVYREIVEGFSAFARGLSFKDIHFTPISALKGDNVVQPSEHMPWHAGGTLLEYFETVPIAADRNLEDFRYPVQVVLRPDLNYRGFAAEIASGIVKQGDEVIVLPSRRKSRVQAIDTFEGELAEAYAPMSVCLRLTDEIDISRGDMLVHPNRLPHVGQSFDATLVWMSEKPLDLEKSYLLKHTTRVVRAQIESVVHLLDLDTLEPRPGGTLHLNDIGRVRVQSHRPLFFDAYAKNRRTGAFILIDSLTHGTVGVGMILEPDGGERLREPAAASRLGDVTQVSPREREDRLGQRGAVVWFGGAVDATAAYALERHLTDLGRVAFVVELTRGDGGGASVPEQVLRKVVEVGVLALVVSPEQTASERLKQGVGERHWVEVPLLLEAETAEQAAGRIAELLADKGFFS